MNTLLLFLLILVFESLEYALKCPVAGQWHLRPGKYKCSATQYVCLLYLPDNIYHETCDGLDYSSRGSKLVFQPNFNKASCNLNRYQPFPFCTDGSSDCVYRKSFCNEEGQLTFSKGISRIDTRCVCDFTKGYTFVINPRNDCYCIPSEEDCSCHKIVCNNKDNHCLQDLASLMNSGCPEFIIPQLPDINKSTKDTLNRIEDKNSRGGPYRLHGLYIMMVLVSMLIVAVLLFFLFANQLTITVTTEKSKIVTDYGKDIKLSYGIDVPFVSLIKSIKFYRNFIECRKDLTIYDWYRKSIELTIKNVGKHDVGKYTCVIETMFTEYRSGSIRVSVNLPLVTAKNTTIAILEYETCIELSCKIESESNLQSVKWYKINDNQPTIVENSTIYSVRGKIPQILRIFDVKASDTGVYKCVVHNAIGPGESDHIQVVYAQHMQEIKEWEEDELTFVETRATHHILASLPSYECIVVTGSSGCGKSSHIHHAALHLRERFGFEIIPVLKGPQEILNHYDKNKKQVFIVDDICGKETINRHILQMWMEHSNKLDKLFKTVDHVVDNKKDGCVSQILYSKLLISCRRHVYKTSKFQLIKVLTKKECNLLSAELCLLKSEKRLMLQKYLPNNTFVDTFKHLHVMNKEDFFPLLCKLAKDKTSEEVTKLFTSPVNSIQTIICNFATENKQRLFALVLCIFVDDWFDFNALKIKSNLEKNKDKLDAFVKEFGIDINNGVLQNSLQDDLNSLIGNFLKQRGTHYRMIHDSIYEISAVTCGQLLPECFIKNAPSVFIRDYFIFEYIEKKHANGDLIVLSKDKEEIYFKRLVSDLKEFIITSSFNNKQLIYQSYIDRMIGFFQTSNEVIAKLKEIDETDCKVKRDDDQHIHVSKHIHTTPLIELASRGYFDIVKFLIIDVKCDVNKTNGRGRTPLYKASKGGHADTVALLLEHHASLSDCSFDKKSALYVASEGGYTHTVKLLLLSNADVNQFSTLKKSPLYVACKGGHTNTVQLLLKNKADVSRCCFQNKSPLYVACEEGHTGIVKLLLQYKADVAQCNTYEESPLFVACQGGHTDILELLPKTIDIISCCNLYGVSPLYVACKGGHTDTVELLLRNNAEFSRCNIYGESPLHAACEGGHTDTVNLLLHRDADVYKCDDCGRSPLRVAYNKEYIDIIKLLFQANAYVNKCDCDRMSPLCVTCSKDNKDILEFYLQHDDVVSH